MKKLTDRLKKIAEMVPKGCTAADIGTDHAYLPVYLVENGICPSVIATDVADGPLQRAVKTLLGYEDRICLRKGDGLAPVRESEADCVIIAGMGGDLIERIIRESGWDLTGKTLLLQPMTKIPELRKWLYYAGFEVKDEKLSEDSGKLYRSFSVSLGEPDRPASWELWAGRLLFENRDPLLSRWLDANIRRLEDAVAGMKAGGEVPPAEYVTALEELKERRS